MSREARGVSEGADPVGSALQTMALNCGQRFVRCGLAKVIIVPPRIRPCSRSSTVSSICSSAYRRVTSSSNFSLPSRYQRTNNGKSRSGRQSLPLVRVKLRLPMKRLISRMAWSRTRSASVRKRRLQSQTSIGLPLPSHPERPLRAVRETGFRPTSAQGSSPCSCM